MTKLKGHCPNCRACVSLDPDGTIGPHRKGGCELAPSCYGAGQQPDSKVAIVEEKPVEAVFGDIRHQVVHI